MTPNSDAAQKSLTVVDFNEITAPGAYVTDQGSLVRVQEDALKEQHSPLITIRSKDNTRLTMISDNPNIPIGKARVLAADADLANNF